MDFSSLKHIPCETKSGQKYTNEQSHQQIILERYF